MKTWIGGWGGLKNGDLLARAETQFDVSVTMDSNMIHQQNLQTIRIAVIVLQARSNRLADTRDLMPKVLGMLGSLRPGTATFIS